MNKNFPDFGGFPTDNSSSTNLKYDIIASKFMTGVQNFEKQKTPSVSSGLIFFLIGAVVEFIVGILLLIFRGIRLLSQR